MKTIRAIFIKQALDLFKNRIVLIQYIIFPVVALVFTELVAKTDDNIPDAMFVTIFAAIFAGMTLINTVAAVIAEDKERKSLRFMIMAGVKPHQYLLGTGSVTFFAAVPVSLLFAIMGGFSGTELFKFMLIMLLSSLASILLGAIVGIIVKNQQSATALGMPVAMILGFTPMITMFNQTIRRLFSVFYTQQLSEVINDLSANLSKPILIVLGNIAVLTVLFILLYKHSGLKTD